MTDRHRNPIKLFVWDFHGTLEHGNDLAVHEITNRVLETKGISRRMSVEEAAQLSGKRWHEYFSFLLPEFDLPTCLELQNACIAISQKHPEIIAKYIQLTPHASQVLEAIHLSQHQQIVLSNTQSHSLEVFLNAVKIDHFFPKSCRLAVDTHCQKRTTKKSWLYDYLKDKPYFSGLVAIGDSTGDIELADCHPKGVGYLYSHPNKPHRLSDCPNKIHDLLVILKEI